MSSFTLAVIGWIFFLIQPIISRQSTCHYKPVNIKYTEASLVLKLSSQLSTNKALATVAKE